MEYEEIMILFEENSNENSQRIYKNHGCDIKCFGSSFALINKLKKKIKINHTLGLKLYKTNILEPRILGIMVLDSDDLTIDEARKIIGETSFYMVSNYLGALFSKTSFAKELIEEEIKSKEEIIKHNGFDILSTILKNDSNRISNKDALKYLKIIEKEIHKSPNRAKNAMNWCLISLGVYKLDITKEVLDVADKIGFVNVDHGKTSCKTPKAREYIEKTLSRKK